MKRYAKWFDEFDEDPEGDWVDYDEAVKEIADLQRQLDEERARIDYLERNVRQEGRIMILDEFEYTKAISLRDALDIARGLDEPGSDA